MEVMKLQLEYQMMPKHLKQILNEKIGGQDFNGMVDFLRDSINTRMPS